MWRRTLREIRTKVTSHVDNEPVSSSIILIDFSICRNELGSIPECAHVEARRVYKGFFEEDLPGSTLTLPI